MAAIKILVIDDEAEFLNTFAKRLARRGIDSVCAGTGKEAIARVEKEEFEAILLDMHLPDMDGNDVLEELLRIRPDSRVVILTGHASIETGRRGIALGAVDYLLKPVEFERLLGTLLETNGDYGNGAAGEAVAVSA